MSAMDDETARACFDRALDGELDRDELAAFEAALARSPALAAAYARHRDVLQAARALHAQASVDLLGDVQSKLRARSGGRFYRDRFAEQRGQGRSIAVIVAISAVFALVALLGLAYARGLFTSARATRTSSAPTPETVRP